MNRIKTINKTDTVGLFAQSSIRHLWVLSFSALSIGCSSSPATPENCQEKQVIAASPASVTKNQAKSLVAKNYAKIFTSLYVDAPPDTVKLKLPEMKTEYFQIVKQDPVYWYVSYEPEAGLWLRARVEKTHGTVEWITVTFAPE